MAPAPHGVRCRRGTTSAAALVAGLVLVGLAGVAEAFWLPPDFGANDPARVVAIGDSITAGIVSETLAVRPYPAALQTLLSPRHPGVLVVNAGRGGETTAGGLARLPFVLAGERPGFVLIMEGTNDATFEYDPGTIVANLRAMVDLVKANHSIPILAAVPPNFRPSADGPRAIIDAVNAMLPGVAAVEGIPFVDTFSALSNGALFSSEDPLHPNQAGYDVLAAAWAPAVGQALDDSLVLLAQTYLLRFNKESFRSGEVLRVDLTLKDRITDGLADIYLGLVLPFEAGPLIGCPLGEGVVFLVDGFTRTVFACLSDPPESAAPLYQDTLFSAPIPVTTIPNFWRALLTSNFPPGVYTLFFAVTPAGDPTRVLVSTLHVFTFTP